ncbi:MAG TPA: fibronectin type III domain-containing protein, partial [Candidatus Paceibacterota bacterium]
YGETKEYDRLAGEGTSLFKKHSVTLSDLDPGTLYHVAAVSYDTSVNLAQSEDTTFTTKGVKGEKVEKDELDEEPGESAVERIKKLPPGVKLSLDKITALLKEFSEEEVARILNEAGLQLVSPPKFTGGEPVITVTQTTATIVWKTDKSSDSRVAYKKHAAYDETKENPYGSEVGNADVFAQDHEVTLENLEPGTMYHYQLRSREQAGRSAKSIDRTFRTKPVTPEATGIMVADRTEHTATIKWKTNVPTKTSIEYKNLRTNKERSQGDPQFTTVHELMLIELDPDSKHEAVIRSENEAGVSAVSKKFTFTTAKDITPPEVSQVRTELSLIPGKSDVVQAVISWRTSEQTMGKVLYDEGLQRNRELRQSTVAGEDLSTAHVVVLNKLRPITIYTFKIVAHDAAGNIGTSKEFKIITPRKEQSVLELIISNFEDIFGFLYTQ